MQPQSQQEITPDLSGFTSVDDWIEKHAGPFFATRSSFDWFVKSHRRELIEAGALITRQGRAGSLVSIEELPRAVIKILKRRALEKPAGQAAA